MQRTIRPDADLVPFAHGTANTLRSLPRFIASGKASRPPALPTSLDMEMMLSKAPVNGVTQARAHYSVTINSEGKAKYVSGAGAAVSKAAVVSVTDTEKKTFVSKVALLEKMPRVVERAYLSLVEMSMSIIVTRGLSMVSLEDVTRASSVLFSISKPQVDFDAQAVHVLLPKTALPVASQPT